MTVLYGIMLRIPAWSQQTGTITGTVIDGETGKPLSGANVFVEDNRLGAATGSNGVYIISSVDSGLHIISVSYIGYEIKKEKITVADSIITLNFTLNQKILQGQEITITATRAKDRETPVAFTNISRQEIQERFRAQDVPFFLQELPGVYATSRNGNGIGYSYLSIRGFNQRRIGVLVNGIPQNDPETHEVYWIDMPDLLGNVQDVQVQRGVGSSLYGGYGIGGIINLETNNFAQQRALNVTASSGSYNTRKFSATFNSGLIDNSWVMNARFSRIYSDGYRERAWADLWSYYFGAAHYSTKTTTRINLYGGPEKTHFAFYGASKETLAKNRRFNPSLFPDDTDNFNQPHYELINDWDINGRTRVSNSLYYIKGDGYFLFRAPLPFDPSFEDVVQKDLLDINQYGWLPRLELRHNRGTFMAGSEIRYNRARHWKEIQTSFEKSITLDDQERYPRPYDYLGQKWMFTLYAHELFDVTPRLTAMAGIQYMYHRYRVGEDQIRNVKFEAPYSFLTPRLGLNYNVTNQINVFGNFSMARSEPSLADLWDPSGVFNTSTPIPVAFRKTDPVRGIWEDPMVKPEELSDWELGIGYQSSITNIKINGYVMDFRNEIIDNGYVGITGLGMRSNAARTMHRGVELSVRLNPIPAVDFSSNLSVSDNYFQKGILYDPSNKQYSVTGNTIANFPGIIFNNRLTFRHKGVFTSFMIRQIGKQYLDNNQLPDRLIDAYTVSSLSLGYTITKIRGLEGVDLIVDIYNLFNAKYESYGHLDFFGNPAWIPGADRNFLFTVKTSF